MNKTLRFAIFGVCTIALGGGLYLMTKRSDAPEPRRRKTIYNYDLALCPGETIPFKVLDPYLRGIVEADSTVDVVLNAFQCEVLRRDAIVLYRFSEFEDPVLRRVVAVEGDKFSVFQQEDGGDWQLKVNGRLVTGASGERYGFGGAEPPPLKLAETARKGVVGNDEAIVFSAFPPGDRDSGIFGIISTTDLIGKATLKGLKQ